MRFSDINVVMEKSLTLDELFINSSVCLCGGPSGMLILIEKKQAKLNAVE